MGPPNRSILSPSFRQHSTALADDTNRRRLPPGFDSGSEISHGYPLLVGVDQPTLDDATRALFRRGHRMEPVIAAEFADAIGLEVHDTGTRTIYQHHDYSWMFATLDRFVIDPELGHVPTELKNVNGRFRKEWDEDIDPPPNYVVQCQHQMAVTGASHAYLVGLIGGDKLAYRLISRRSSIAWPKT